MHDSSLARRHGTEPVGFRRSPYLLGRNSRGCLQFFNPQRAEIFAIEPDLLVLIALQVQNFRREQLKRTQQLAPAIEQQRGIRPGKLHQDFRMLPLAVLRDRRIDGDAVFQFKAAVRYHGLQKFPNLLRGSNLVCNRHR